MTTPLRMRMPPFFFFFLRSAGFVASFDSVLPAFPNTHVGA